MSDRNRYTHHLAQAKVLLNRYQSGDTAAIKLIHETHPESENSNFSPNLQDARLVICSQNNRVKSLSLEHLKKEAKRLLKGVKSGCSLSLERVVVRYPKLELPNGIKLAHVQYVIAKENGLASWAKLKAHIEFINIAQKKIQTKKACLDNDLRTLHIRCGDDIHKALRTCGFNGNFLEISNPFAQGPVPTVDPIKTFINIRAKFINRAYMDYMPVERDKSAYEEIEHVEKVLRNIASENNQKYERLVLWFEHDPFDQLCLAYVLYHLSNVSLEGIKLELIQIEQYPGVNHFIGIGQLCRQPENIFVLWQQRKKVTTAMTAFGARCWNAYTSVDPTELSILSSKQMAPLPFMPSALKRMLQELPWTSNGLSLTEQLALKIINRDGPIQVAPTFHFLMSESEPLPFLGDIMFLYILRGLWENMPAALGVQSCDSSEPPMFRELLVITEIGKQLLAGELNWMDLPTRERWVGGMQLKSQQKNWYWSPEEERPIFK